VPSQKSIDSTGHLRHIATLDLKIAAIAIVHDATLLSRSSKVFGGFPTRRSKIVRHDRASIAVAAGRAVTASLPQATTRLETIPLDELNSDRPRTGDLLWIGRSSPSVWSRSKVHLKTCLSRERGRVKLTAIRKFCRSVNIRSIRHVHGNS